MISLGPQSVARYCQYSMNCLSSESDEPLTNMYSFNPIATIQTPFREKFGIPRQASLSQGVTGTLLFTKAYNNPDFLRGIEAFSHLWLTFVFDRHIEQETSALVRPPRLGGNAKIGVFASRSSFRPNPIGLSLVKYVSHTFSNGQLSLTVSGVDIVDQTPILDIKPFIAYSDNADGAQCSYAEEVPTQRLNVSYSKHADEQIAALSTRYPRLKETINTMLGYDPRPAYKHDKVDSKIYKVGVFDLDITFTVEGTESRVSKIEKVE